MRMEEHKVQMGINILLWEEWGKEYPAFSMINPGLQKGRKGRRGMRRLRFVLKDET